MSHHGFCVAIGAQAILWLAQYPHGQEICIDGFIVSFHLVLGVSYLNLTKFHEAMLAMSKNKRNMLPQIHCAFFFSQLTSRRFHRTFPKKEETSPHL